jgi:hypothetical protein
VTDILFFQGFLSGWKNEKNPKDKKKTDDRRDLSLKDIYLKRTKRQSTAVDESHRQRGGFFQMAPLYVHTDRHTHTHTLKERRTSFLFCVVSGWNFFASIHFRNKVKKKRILGVNCFTSETETAHLSSFSAHTRSRLKRRKKGRHKS